MPIKDVDWEVSMEGWVGNKSQKRDRKKRKEDLRQVRNAKGKIQVREVDGSCHNLPPPLEGSV